MQEFQSLETSILVDMLASLTADYTKMLSEGAPAEEFEKCNLNLRALQAEIDLRKKTSANTDTTDPNIILPPDYSNS